MREMVQCNYCYAVKDRPPVHPAGMPCPLLAELIGSQINRYDAEARLFDAQREVAELEHSMNAEADRRRSVL